MLDNPPRVSALAASASPRRPFAAARLATPARAAPSRAFAEVHSLASTSALIREHIAEAFPGYELFVFAHPSSTRPDGQVENWDLRLRKNGQGRFQTADEQAREMAAELAQPHVAAALNALRPTAVRFFNATEYETVFTGEEQSECFERQAPKDTRNKGGMDCCHFSHRGPALWGVSQCLTMVQVRALSTMDSSRVVIEKKDASRVVVKTMDVSRVAIETVDGRKSTWMVCESSSGEKRMLREPSSKQ